MGVIAAFNKWSTRINDWSIKNEGTKIFGGAAGWLFNLKKDSSFYKRDMQRIRRAFELGLRPDDKGDLETEKTFLMEALQYRLFDLAELCIEYGTDVNAKDAKKHPVIEYALVDDSGEMVRKLIEKGADPNVMIPWDVKSGTNSLISYAPKAHMPLISWACGSANVSSECIEALLEGGADVNAPTIYKTAKEEPEQRGNALLYAIERAICDVTQENDNLCKIVELLLKYGVNYNYKIKYNFEINGAPVVADITLREYAKLKRLKHIFEIIDRYSQAPPPVAAMDSLS